MTTPAVIHFDGGAHPPDNEPAAIGYTVEIDGSTEESDFARIGTATCNEVEYHPLIRGLETASEKGCTEVEAREDSQLIVRQVTGEWQTNDADLWCVPQKERTTT